jgi:hypothetical protein
MAKVFAVDRGSQAKWKKVIILLIDLDKCYKKELGV